MSKFTTLFMIALLLSPMLTYAAARPGPSMVETQHRDADMENAEVDHEAICEGVNNSECLIRRTLAAHVDYIYTQKQHKP